jgi:tetratricopeptide (TPR) repeat protein
MNKDQEALTHMVFSPIGEALATQKADELLVLHKLQDAMKDQYVKDQAEVFTQEIQKRYKAFVKQMEHASGIIKEALEKLPKQEQTQYRKEFSHAASRLKVPTESQAGLFKEFIEASSLQQFLGFSSQTLLFVYQTAYSCYQHHKLEDAHTLFQFLVLLNGLVCDYWIALGFAKKSLEDLSGALDCFAMAICLNPELPLPRVQSAELYLHLGQFSDATAELEIAKDLIIKHKVDFPLSEVESLLIKAKNRKV